MARLQGRTLFFITSPRTPMKMLPEISLLVKEFSGKPWNATTQEQFMKSLAEDPNFEGVGSPSDLAFSAKIYAMKVMRTGKNSIHILAKTVRNILPLWMRNIVLNLQTLA